MYCVLPPPGDDVDLTFGRIIEADALCDSPVLIGIAASETQELQPHGLGYLLNVSLTHEMNFAKVAHHFDNLLVCSLKGFH